MAAPHRTGQPSAWVTRWAHLLAPGGRVLDLACGAGRHAHWLATLGYRVTALDRDVTALAALRADWPADAPYPANVIEADVENHPWPLAGQQFDGIVVTNYLWRTLWPNLLAALAPGGIYIHETFAHGNASVGKPSRPDFLLQPGELLQACTTLRTVAFEDGFCTAPERYVQRIVAVREATAAATATPPRYKLDVAA
ncbi:MAG: class I SAM-dependent methyltransferase [Burkholderiales bacterium]|jgi:SAM-dependent methyltransferase|nr:class I SAM-dependent methyltransferase [Burkholderiales bacterium]